MTKTITLKDGHTMYAASYNKMVDRVINGCNEKLMPVHYTTIKTNEEFDLTFQVENYCPVKFKHIMQHERYESTVNTVGNKTNININFY